LTPTVWPWIFALAGALVLVGAVVMLLRAAHWPVSSDRFQRQPSAQLADLADDPAGVWRALDAGFDPTSDPPDRNSPDNADPDVQIGDAGDTMVAKQSDQAPESGQGQHPDQGQADQPARSGQSTSSPE
jgi:Tryptophan-associated transmembrane protein (Trp_oprn_chp)